MAAKRSAAEMEQLRREFLVRAEAAFEQMFGADGQNALVTFTERENRACEVTDALARAAYLSEDDRAARFYDQRPPARWWARTGESGLHERSCTQADVVVSARHRAADTRRRRWPTIRQC